MGVEDVIHQNGGLAQRDADVHGHGHLGHNAVHLVHQVDELGQGERAQVGRAGSRVQLAVAGIFGLAAEQHGGVTGRLQALDEGYPLGVAPEAGGPAVAAAGVEADARAGGWQSGPVVALVVVGVEHVLFAPEIEAAELKYFLHVGLGVGLAHLVEHAGEELVLGQRIHGPGHAVVGAQGVAVFLLGLDGVQQGAGFLLLVKVNHHVELPGLEL